MASSATDDLETDDILSTIHEDHLTCQICLSQFINPKALKCLHSFCLSCMQVYCGSKGTSVGGEIVCPTCRRVTAMPPSGVAGLSDNHLLKSLLDTCSQATAAQASKKVAREASEKTNHEAKSKQKQPKPQQDQHAVKDETKVQQIKKSNQTQLIGIVSFTYIAKKDDELDLKAGDFISVSSRTEVESGWLRGVLNGKDGIFPANHLKSIVEVKAEERKEQETKAAVTNKTAQPKKKTPPVPPPPIKKPKPRKEVKKEQGVRAVVAYDYTPNLEDELELQKGDLILIDRTIQVEEGWLGGTINGKTGLFPDNFVEIVAADDDDEEEEEDGANDEPETNVDNQPAPDKVNITMIIPKMYVGMVIGKKGSTIKEIIKKSGAKVVFRTRAQTDSLKPAILAIKGSAACVQQAKEMVERLLSCSKKPAIPVATDRSLSAPVRAKQRKTAAAAGVSGKPGAGAQHMNTKQVVANSSRANSIERPANIKPAIVSKGRTEGKKKQHVRRAELIASELVKGMDEKLSTNEMLERMEKLLMSTARESSVSGRGQDVTDDSRGAAGGAVRQTSVPGQIQSQEYVVLEIKVPQDAVGGVIGRHGTRIKEIMDKLQVDLHFSKKDEACSYSTLRIFGTVEAAEQAQAVVIGMAEHFMPGFNPLIGEDACTNLASKCTIELLIPHDFVGKVIGKQGVNIKEIRQKSGAEVEFKDSANEKLPFKMLRITGSRTSVLQAEEIVNRIVTVDRSTAPGSDNAVAIARPKPLMNDTVLQMHITKCLVGIVLGKGWSNVKGIEEKTGAKLTLKDDNKVGGNIKTMLISGSPDSAAKAKAMVGDILSKIHVQEVQISAAVVQGFYGYNGKSMLTDICRNTGARIHVVDAVSSQSGEMKRISISGTKDAVKIAKSQLEAKVEYLSEASAPARARGISPTPTKDEQPLRVVQKEELFECGCCYDYEVKFEAMGACEDGHLFCRLCILRNCEEMIGQGRGKFPCLTDECDCQFPGVLLQSVLPKRLYSKAMQLVQEDEIRQANLPDLVSCPHCVYAVEMPHPLQSVLHCQNPYCRKATCRYCKEPDHLPLRCDQVKETQGETKMRTNVENLQTEAMVRVCFKCRRRFCKLDGCNKMTCPCGATMCYVCRAPNIDYHHFDRFNIMASGKTRCPLYSDTDELHKEEVKKAKDDATNPQTPSVLVKPYRYLLNNRVPMAPTINVTHPISIADDKMKKHKEEVKKAKDDATNPQTPSVLVKPYRYLSNNRVPMAPTINVTHPLSIADDKMKKHKEEVKKAKDDATNPQTPSVLVKPYRYLSNNRVPMAPTINVTHPISIADDKKKKKGDGCCIQ